MQRITRVNPPRGTLSVPTPAWKTPLRSNRRVPASDPQGHKRQTLVLPKGACSWAQQSQGRKAGPLSLPGTAPKPPADVQVKITFQPTRH